MAAISAQFFLRDFIEKVLQFDRPFGPRVVVAAGAAIYSQRYGISLPALILILTPVEESWYM